MQGLAVAAVFLVGYTPAFALLGLYAAVVLWLYGSFWVTGAVMIIGGLLTYPVIWLLSFCHTSQKSRLFGRGDSEVVLSFHYLHITTLKHICH